MRVSIIITARNYGQYLAEAIGSALWQTIPCEVIYSDDCSDDNSLEIAKSLGVKVVPHDTHVGVAKARNDGFDASTGDAVVFMDGDDILPRNFIEKHLETFDENTPFVYCSAQAFGDFETLWKVFPWGTLDLWNRNFVNTSHMVWRQKFIEAGKWQKTPVETMWDFHLALRLARLGTPRKSGAVLLYRQHGNSTSVAKRERNPDRTNLCAQEIRKELLNLTVGLVYSGRLPKLLDRWMTSLIQDVEFLNKPELIIYNNSTQNLEKRLEKYKDRFSKIKIINDPTKIVFKDEIERRNKVCELLGNAYSMIMENASGDMVHLREDDIITPKGGFRKMFDFLNSGTNLPDAVAGIYQNRHRDTFVGGHFSEDFRHNKELVKFYSEEPLKVDYTGTGCILFWKHRVPKIFKPYLDGIQAHDWAWCHDLKQKGGNLHVLPDVVCKHYVDEYHYLQPEIDYALPVHPTTSHTKPSSGLPTIGVVKRALNTV